mmetsp:Transcript_42401/g.95954  ORF Transcript_42401/g.95954 Transcript_42401/m.95954 type:complete len:99 (+) Transcript_42401:864-1160(+)
MRGIRSEVTKSKATKRSRNISRNAARKLGLSRNMLSGFRKIELAWTFGPLALPSGLPSGKAAKPIPEGEYEVSNAAKTSQAKAQTQQMPTSSPTKGKI